MPSLIDRPPSTAIEPVTDVLHGVSITDPYRWLEDQNSPHTRTWIEEQTRYARSYLANLPGRDRIRERVRELLDVETYDSFLKVRNRYFFRKRLPGQEQACIYLREGADGQDQLLLDPATRGTGEFTSIKPVTASYDGNLLLFEIKQGGERTGIFEIFDVTRRATLPDTLPHGYLRGFAFGPNNSFYYVHDCPTSKRPHLRAAHLHQIGTSFDQDREIFRAGEGQKLRLTIVPGRQCLGLLVYRFNVRTYIDFYLLGMGSNAGPVEVIRNGDYSFVPSFLGARILAVTDRNAPNRRVVEVQPRKAPDPLFFDLVPERDASIRDWAVTANHIVVSYAHGGDSQIDVHDSHGRPVGQIPCESNETVRVVCADVGDDEVFLERQSFAQPIAIQRYSLTSRICAAWSHRKLAFDLSCFTHSRVNFTATDGTPIPMSLVGQPDAHTESFRPTLLTAYGGLGIPMTPQFSVLTAFLIERGCLFALANIRGGSEFGAEWHQAAKSQNRQTAFDDFLSAAHWLINNHLTTPQKLAIFGGSNSGLLVSAALSQRPELFRAVLCIAPMTDMLRYHLFDNAYIWRNEYGTVEDAAEFHALLGYSPYHAVREGIPYPATMIVSGDADQSCNPMHARKMTARLQSASSSEHPIFLDYNVHRGHVPVLPFTTRLEALTDRLAFLSDQLGIAV
jgi:prolyl oligopeptidase